MTVSQYNQCVDNFSDGVYRFILKNMRNEDNANDIVQEAFIKLWEKHKEVDITKAKSYLFTTAYHQMIDFFRKNKRMNYMEDNNSYIHLLENGAKEGEMDLNRMMHLALEKVPKVQKNAVLLRDYEGYSYEEIGEILSLSSSQVKVYIYRARKTMRMFIGSLDNIM